HAGWASPVRARAGAYRLAVGWPLAISRSVTVGPAAVHHDEADRDHRGDGRPVHPGHLVRGPFRVRGAAHLPGGLDLFVGTHPDPRPRDDPAVAGDDRSRAGDGPR